MSESVMEEGIEHVTQEKKIGPGAALRAAREARKLTVEAASHQLHVDAAVVRALEEDDFDKFAAPIFVTGHLRAYARLLDLPPEPLIGAYHQLGVDAPPPLKQVKRGVRFGSSSSLVPGVIVILVLGLAIALFAGLQNGERGIETPPAEDNHLTPPEALAPAVPPQNANEVAPGSAAGDVAATDEGANADAADVAVSAPTPPPSAETGTPAAAGPRATLSLKADQASWVEVRDANGRRLLYDLLDPGASRNVEGIAPFAVLLGYGPGVTVEFNGRLIDHRRYMREDVARFRVGEQGIDKL